MPTVDVTLAVREAFGVAGLFRISSIGEATVGVTTRYGSKPHFHDGYSIGIFHGQAQIRFRGALHAVGPDVLIVIEPGEVHGGGDESANCIQDGLVVDPAFIVSLFGCCQPMRFADAVVRNSALVEQFAAGLRARSPERLRAALHQLFVQHGVAETKDAPPQTPRPMDTARSIGAQARAARLSRWHYSRKIRAETGLSPRDLRRQQRVQFARMLIEQGREIVEVAMETGFADQAHMTRQMRMMLGVTPGELRKALR